MALKQLQHGKLTGSAPITRGKLTYAKPKQVAAAEPAPKVKEAPRLLYYQFLPLAKIRRHLRAPCRRRGKGTKHHTPHRRLRDTRYKPFFEGWLWPQPPHYSSLPYQKPKKKKKKKKKGIPQWGLDE